MVKALRPTIRSVWLGQELRALREEAGYSLRGIGADIGVNQSIVSKLEAGKTPPSARFVDDYIRVCGVHDRRRINDLHTICRDVNQKGWWDGYDMDVAPGFMDHIWIESKARKFDSFEPSVFPGILQTPAYATALFLIGNPNVGENELNRWREVRMTRQQIITGHEPVQYRCILDGQLFARLIGGTDVMRNQLDYLLDVMSKPHVEIRVIPADTPTGVNGPFEVFELKDPYPNVGYVATPVGDICVEGDAVDELARTYDRLQEASLDPAASRELITAERNKL